MVGKSSAITQPIQLNMKLYFKRLHKINVSIPWMHEYCALYPVEDPALAKNLIYSTGPEDIITGGLNVLPPVTHNLFLSES